MHHLQPETSHQRKGGNDFVEMIRVSDLGMIFKSIIIPLGVQDKHILMIWYIFHPLEIWPCWSIWPVYKWRFDVRPKDKILETSVFEIHKRDVVFGHNGVPKQRDKYDGVHILEWCFKHGMRDRSKGVHKMNGILAQAERWIGPMGNEARGLVEFKVWQTWCGILFMGWYARK